MATVIGMAGAKNFSKILKLPLAQSGAAMYYIQPALEEGASENGGNVGITKTFLGSDSLFANHG